jgi:hypothetical protein
MTKAEIAANPERRNVTRIEMDFTYTGEETLLIIVRPVVDTALEFRSQGNFGLHRVSAYVKNNIIDQQPNYSSSAGRPICIMSGTRFAHTVTSSYKVHPVQLVSTFPVFLFGSGFVFNSRSPDFLPEDQ